MNTPGRRTRLSSVLRRVRHLCLAGWLVGLVTVFYLQYQANAESRWMEQRLAQLSGQLAEAARINQQLHALVAKRERPDRIKRLVAEHLPDLRPSLPEQIEPYGQADEVPPDYLLQPLPKPFTEAIAPFERTSDTTSDSLGRRHGRLFPPSGTAPPGSPSAPGSPGAEFPRCGARPVGGGGAVSLGPARGSMSGPPDNARNHARHNTRAHGRSPFPMRLKERAFEKPARFFPREFSPRHRVQCLGLVLLFCLALAVLRLVSVPWIHVHAWVDWGAQASASGLGSDTWFSSYFEEAAQSLAAPRTRYSPPLPSRAALLDRRGVLLAGTVQPGTLIIHPRELRAAHEDPTQVGETLVDIIGPQARSAIFPRIETKNTPFIAFRKLTPAMTARLDQLGLHGLYVERNPGRYYPHGEILGPLLGFVDADGRPGGGLELSLNEAILGSDAPLSLSMDIRYQTEIYAMLQEALIRHQAKGACAILMDMQTAELLALVSLPGYNPNRFEDHHSGDYRICATEKLYEPGSILKLATIAAALDQRTVRVSDVFPTSHQLVIDGHAIADVTDHGTDFSLEEIVTRSSNIGAARVGLQLGPELQTRYFKALGLLSPPGVRLPRVPQTFAQLDGRPLYVASMAYGYGIALTPLHLLNMSATLVGDGKHRVTKIYRQNPLVARASGVKVLSDSTVQSMRDLMRKVVRQGTGVRAQIPGYDVGGKTGTAVVWNPQANQYEPHRARVSFIGVMPMSNPKFGVYVMLEEPQPQLIRGELRIWASRIAAPLVRDIFLRLGPMAGFGTRPEAASAVSPVSPVSPDAAVPLEPSVAPVAPSVVPAPLPAEGRL